MATSQSVPVLMRVLSASLTLAKRAGQIIRDVQMSGTSLDIVEKVTQVFHASLINEKCFEIGTLSSGPQRSADESRSSVATINHFLVEQTFSSADDSRRRSEMKIPPRTLTSFVVVRTSPWKNLPPRPISTNCSTPKTKKFYKFNVPMNSAICKKKT